MSAILIPYPHCVAGGIGCSEQVARPDRPARSVGLHIDSSCQRHILAAFQDAGLLELNAGIHAARAADDSSHARVVSLATHFQMTGILFVDDHDGAFGKRLVTIRYLKRLRQICATKERQSASKEIHVLTRSRIVESNVLNARIQAPDLHIAADAVATEVGQLPAGAVDGQKAATDESLAIRSEVTRVQVHVLGAGGVVAFDGGNIWNGTSG